MSPEAFWRFSALRDEFRKRVDEWNRGLPGLLAAQEALARELGEDDYRVETPVVYNRALDEVGADADIAWIVIADNPGKREQEAGAQRYLIGRSGQATERFFRAELGLELRAKAIIVNKTPVHTPKTAQLRKLGRLHPELAAPLVESQRYMAELALGLFDALGARLWIMGLSELKPKGLFAPWLETFRAGLEGRGRALGDAVYAFNHFSMGSFAADMKRRKRATESAVEAALRIGRENSQRLFGY